MAAALLMGGAPDPAAGGVPGGRWHLIPHCRQYLRSGSDLSEGQVGQGSPEVASILLSQVTGLVCEGAATPLQPLIVLPLSAPVSLTQRPDLWNLQF